MPLNNITPLITGGHDSKRSMSQPLLAILAIQVQSLSSLPQNSHFLVLKEPFNCEVFQNFFKSGSSVASLHPFLTPTFKSVSSSLGVKSGLYLPMSNHLEQNPYKNKVKVLQSIYPAQREVSGVRSGS